MITRRKLLAGCAAAGFLGVPSISSSSSRPPTSSGQLMLSGFRGTRASDPEVDFIRRYIENGDVAGVLLLERNIQSPDQLERLIRSLREASSDLPPIISIDQEGGNVSRVGPANGFTSWESAADIALSGRNNVEVLDYYFIRANELAEVGVSLNLGPVVDLNVNPYNRIIGAKGRSFGRRVDDVVRFAELFIRAHRDAGVKTCLKHFPGHGSSLEDSHIGTVDVSQSWSAAEIAPFERLVKAGYADTIMNAHVLHRYLSDEPWIPTSLSTQTNIELREGLAFDGPIISDDMQMGAITDVFAPVDAAISALSAGNTLLIYSNFKDKYGIDTVYEIAKSVSEVMGSQGANPLELSAQIELVRQFRSSL